MHKYVAIVAVTCVKYFFQDFKDFSTWKKLRFSKKHDKKKTQHPFILEIKISSYIYL